MSNLLLLLVLLAMAAYLYRKYQQDQTTTKQDRSRLLDDCISLLTEPTLIQQGMDFPKLNGIYDGFSVSLELLVDTLAVRKVPPLWLMVNIKGKRPINGSLDIVVRPQNNEFYSPSWQWDGNLQAPHNWPAHSSIKYQKQPASLDVLNQYVPVLFQDEHMKELLVMPDFVRLTYLAKQADRGEYMIMRNSVFESEPIDKTVVEQLIKQAIAIRNALEMEHHE